MRHTLLSPVWPTHVGHHSGHNIMGIYGSIFIADYWKWRGSFGLRVVDLKKNGRRTRVAINSMDSFIYHD
jgi:hypothetical protein